MNDFTIKRTLRWNNNLKSPQLPTSPLVVCHLPLVPPCPTPSCFSASAHSWPSESLWKLMADSNRSWQEEEMSWILKSSDDNVKLVGRESPAMHPVWEKLQPFLDIWVPSWELSLGLSWAEALLVPCLWSWLCPFNLLPRLWLFFPTLVNSLFSSVLCTAWTKVVFHQAGMKM